MIFALGITHSNCPVSSKKLLQTFFVVDPLPITTLKLLCLESSVPESMWLQYDSRLFSPSHRCLKHKDPPVSYIYAKYMPPLTSRTWPVM
jgi:hypothetical protein